MQSILDNIKSRSLWAEHEFNEHFSEPKWRCFRCKTKLPTRDAFAEHLAREHGVKLSDHQLHAALSEAVEYVITPEFTKHPCPLCLQTDWKSRREYTTHVGRHLEEISLASLPRQEYDDWNSDAQRFLESDSSEKGLGHALKETKTTAHWQCSFCQKRFTRGGLLRAHLLTHTGKKPFVCSVCGKKFMHRNDIKRHERLHLDEAKSNSCKSQGTPPLTATSQVSSTNNALGRHFPTEAGRKCIKEEKEEVTENNNKNNQDGKQESPQAFSKPSSTKDDGISQDSSLPAATLAQPIALNNLQQDHPPERADYHGDNEPSLSDGSDSDGNDKEEDDDDNGDSNGNRAADDDSIEEKKTTLQALSFESLLVRMKYCSTEFGGIKSAYCFFSHMTFCCSVVSY